jgi:catechol 2,3-dioxygenase-like lactoylglutathione lyase family enzyme
MKVLFIAGFGPIASDISRSRQLYEEALGIRFKVEEGDYLHTEEVKGAQSFAVWPLAQAAESCFGDDTWPPDVPAPQAWLEFDVDDVEEATRELEARGYRLLVRNRTEPWGQVVTRLISPEGLLVGVTLTPWMREGGAPA